MLSEYEADYEEYTECSIGFEGILQGSPLLVTLFLNDDKKTFLVIVEVQENVEDEPVRLEEHETLSEEEANSILFKYEPLKHSYTEVD